MWQSVAFQCFCQSSGRHNQRSFIRHIFSHFSFMILKPCEKRENCVFTSVYKRAKSRAITPHDHVRKPAWLVLLCFHCKAMCIIRLAAAYLSQHAFKVGINHLGGFHPFMKVFERHLVFSHFWHLRSCWAFQQPFAFLFVPQISRSIL